MTRLEATAAVAAFMTFFWGIVILSASFAPEPRPECPSSAESALGMSREDLRHACMSASADGASNGLSCGQMRTLAFGSADGLWAEAGVAAAAFAYHCMISSDSTVPVAHLRIAPHDGRWDAIAEFDGCATKRLVLDVSAGTARYSGGGMEIEGAATENGWVLASNTVTAVMGPLEDALIYDRLCGRGRVAIIGDHD